MLHVSILINKNGVSIQNVWKKQNKGHFKAVS